MWGCVWLYVVVVGVFVGCGWKLGPVLLRHYSCIFPCFQDTFVERIIEPRVRPSRLHKPPSYDEAVETETEKSDLEDEEEEDDDVDNKESSEEESERQSSEEEEEEEEEQNATAPKPAARPKPQPAYPPGTMPLQPGMQAYPAYPPMGYMGGYPVAPGQFVPIIAAPPTQQLPPPTAGPGHPPPRYPGQPAPQGRVKPTDPPIYSYLVQRGYTPLDAGRDSPVSAANTSHSQASMEDSDKNILDSGVEYMRR